MTDELAITLDIMPTLLDVAHVAPPSDRSLDGSSLLPLWTESKTLADRALYWAHGNQLAMRRGPWKLVVDRRDRSRPQLFQLSEDLQEANDLADTFPARTQAMLGDLAKWEHDVQTDVTPQPHEIPIDGVFHAVAPEDARNEDNNAQPDDR